jgi:dTDP-4-dehydrorhamnose 3,5-epimerase
MKLNGALILKPEIYSDKRGHFLEVFRQTELSEVGINKNFVQANRSFSQKNVIRGLHFQNPDSQGKLIQVLTGKIFEVIVDLRKSSSTFMSWEAIILDSSNYESIFVPEGCAHGFAVLSDGSDILYSCTDYYHPANEKGIRFDDPDLNIPWPIKSPIVSDKDSGLPRLKELGSYLFT